MGQEIEIKVTGYQIIEKTVKASGNSGRVYVPIEWVGRKVKVVLIEPPTEFEEDNKSISEKTIYHGA
jgi:putative transposon-encoded protein